MSLDLFYIDSSPYKSRLMSTYTLGKASRTKDNLFPSVFREHKMVHRNQNGMSYRTLVRTDTGLINLILRARGV